MRNQKLQFLESINTQLKYVADLIQLIILYIIKRFILDR